MLNCLPQSICSWDFRVPATDNPGAELYFDFWGEQGRIIVGNDLFEISKAGLFSGKWALLHNGQTIAEAVKADPFFRRFEIDFQGVRFTIKAVSLLTSSFEFVSNDRQIGLIQKAHPFTRRSTIDCPAEIPYLAQLFAFWLAALLWRRAARSSSSTAGSH